MYDKIVKRNGCLSVLSEAKRKVSKSLRSVNKDHILVIGRSAKMEALFFWMCAILRRGVVANRHFHWMTVQSECIWATISRILWDHYSSWKCDTILALVQEHQWKVGALKPPTHRQRLSIISLFHTWYGFANIRCRCWWQVESIYIIYSPTTNRRIRGRYSRSNGERGLRWLGERKSIQKEGLVNSQNFDSGGEPTVSIIDMPNQAEILKPKPANNSHLRRCWSWWTHQHNFENVKVVSE